MQVTYGSGFAVAPTREQLRAQILRLQDEMLADPRCTAITAPGGTTPDFPVTHFRAPGMVARQMLLPKGGLIIGKIHRHSHLNQISFGHCIVVTEAGEREIKGPTTFANEPGAKRAVLVLEDTLWTTFHLNPNNYDPDNEDDMRKLEAEIIATSYDELANAIPAHKAAQLEGALA